MATSLRNSTAGPESRGALYFDADKRMMIDPYLPDGVLVEHSRKKRPFLTLTYACSLDSQLALSSSQQTVLSGMASKSMTHYLRTKHEAILIGSGTAIADDPTLNSRLADVSASGIDAQPRPVILDRRARWKLNEGSRVVRAALEGQGKAPWLFVDSANSAEVSKCSNGALERCGGRVLSATTFDTVLDSLAREGIASVMVEGGAELINAIMHQHQECIDAIIVTVAPLYLGAGGPAVLPSRVDQSTPTLRLTSPTWMSLGDDAVLCAKVCKKTG